MPLAQRAASCLHCAAAVTLAGAMHGNELLRKP